MENKYQFNAEEHIHTLNGVPLMGTSTVVSVLAKFGLTWWSSAKAVETLGWLHPKKNTKRQVTIALNKGYKTIQNAGKKEFGEMLERAYRAHSDSLEESAFRGTAMHAELERYIKGQMSGKKVRPNKYTKAYASWARGNIKRYLWSEAHCYSELLWVGGISDVGVELNDGTYAIIDFKSSKEAYTSQFIQIMLYGIQVEENGLFDKEGNSIGKLDKDIGALIIFPFGMKEVKPVIKRNIYDFYAVCGAVVQLYKLMKDENEKTKQEKSVASATRKRARVSKRAGQEVGSKSK